MFHIIDDEKFLCDIISDIIASLGYHSQTFICPSEYIDYTEQAEYTPPVAIISDIKMPNMNGFEMMDKVLKNKPNIKFVMMSGYIPEENETPYKPCHFLSKPFDISKLIEILESLMQDHKAYQSNE